MEGCYTPQLQNRTPGYPTPPLPLPARASPTIKQIERANTATKTEERSGRQNAMASRIARPIKALAQPPIRQSAVQLSRCNVRARLPAGLQKALEKLREILLSFSKSLDSDHGHLRRLQTHRTRQGWQEQKEVSGCSRGLMCGLW